MTVLTGKTPDLIAFLQDTIKTILEAKKISPDQAEEIAVEVADQISFEWGGSMYYVPKSTGNLLCRRNERIIAEFTGSNHAELGRKYKVSVQWIYNLLRKHKQAVKRNKSR